MLEESLALSSIMFKELQEQASILAIQTGCFIYLFIFPLK